MNHVDLRSDTVTRPTPAMREAMSRAEVGDDVYGEDPTVNRLQALAAERVGKEAGLFVASGTMGNFCAVLAHCGRGDEAIVGRRAHIFLHEGGNLSAFGGVHSSQLDEQRDGSLDLAEVAEAIRDGSDDHHPVTRLVCLENTHNACGGVCQPPAYVKRLAALAHRRNLLVHMDGARLFNSAVAQQVDVRQLTAPVDSVTFCLSKGLAAPSGSVLCGSREFIRVARRIRKHIGGGMRQVGILAAAGIVALETMVARLADDHARARALARRMAKIPAIQLEPGTPATNMIFFTLADSVRGTDAQIEKRLARHGVLVFSCAPRRFRAVLHADIHDEDIPRAAKGFERAFG